MFRLFRPSAVRWCGSSSSSAAGRVASSFDAVEDNDDERMTAIAKLAYKRGEYGYSFFED